ncbi:MAG: glycosyltransferase, partial [candidate division WOR-3 bacterium]
MLKYKPVTILDIGCGKGEFLEKILYQDHENVELLNNVIALDLRQEYLYEMSRKYKVYKTVIGDACNLPFKDKSIDLIVCNALLEHIPVEKRKKFATEIQRCAKNYWVAAPSRYSLFEVHYYLPFIGWLKPIVRDKIIKFLGKELHNDPINLPTFKEFKILFSDATQFYKINILGLFEHLIAVKVQDRKKLSIILPTEAKLEEAKKVGLLSRWKFYLSEMSKHFEVEVYSCDKKNYSRVLGVKHINLPISLDFLPYGNQVFYNFYLLIRSFKMSKILRVISVSYFILPLLRLFGKIIILSYQYDYKTTTNKDFGGIKGLTAVIREWLSIKSADKVICTTEELYRKVKEVYKKDSIIIPNFVDTTKFKPLEKENYILYAGRILWHKGIDYLIEAFALVEKQFDIKLKLAGLGDLDLYKEKAKKLGIKNIEFLGSVDNDKMPEIMGKAKIFVLPTVTREGHPKALIEAMACGCACIATDVPGNREV